MKTGVKSLAERFVTTRHMYNFLTPFPGVCRGGERGRSGWGDEGGDTYRCVGWGSPSGVKHLTLYEWLMGTTLGWLFGGGFGSKDDAWSGLMSGKHSSVSHISVHDKY